MRTVEKFQTNFLAMIRPHMYFLIVQETISEKLWLQDYSWILLTASLAFFLPSTIIAKYEQKFAPLSIIWGIWNEYNTLSEKQCCRGWSLCFSSMLFIFSIYNNPPGLSPKYSSTFPIFPNIYTKKFQLTCWHPRALSRWQSVQVGLLQACQQELRTDNCMTVPPAVQASPETVQTRWLRSVTP